MPPSSYCLILPFNHFDLLWRRCWDRQFTHNGFTFASYREIEAFALEDALAACRTSNFTYGVESATILRAFLETHPEALPEVRALAQAGRFEVQGGGEVICDLNIPGGESLLRNWVLGTLWSEETLGVSQPVATVRDAFGQSAQVPQMLRGCEYELVTDCFYGDTEGPYWRGLDGSTILQANLPTAGMGSGKRLDPDPATKGQPGPGNHERGVVENRIILKLTLEERHRIMPFFTLLVGAEEGLPHPDTAAYIDEMRDKYPWCEFHFGLTRDLVTHLAPQIAHTDDPPLDLLSHKMEGNPAAGSVTVTRIELKLRQRRAEHDLLTAEAFCAASSTSGAEYPAALLRDTWRKLCFTQFHDSITATHIDPAYQELLDTYDAIATQTATAMSSAACALAIPTTNEIVSVFNPHSAPVTELASISLPAWASTVTVADAQGNNLPIAEVCDGQAMVVLHDLAPFAITQLQVRATNELPVTLSTNERVMANDRFRVTSDGRGIIGIVDLALGRELVDDRFLHMGELILEEDQGECWSTLNKHKDRWPLAPYMRHVATLTTPGMQRMIFEGDASGMEDGRYVYALGLQQEVSIYRGLPRVEFRTTVQWDTYDRRLRIAFPTSVPGDWRGQGIYSIPYGHLRRNRYEQTEDGRVNKSGDWPAQGWVAVVRETVDPFQMRRHQWGGVAVLNTGTPSHRIEEGTILVSLLRSPNLPTFLHDEHYNSDLYQGMRDKGRHTFIHGVIAFDGELVDSPVLPMAAAMNQPPMAVPGALHSLNLPQLRALGTAISTIKQMENGDGLAVRLWEFRGVGETVTLTLPDGYTRAQRTNMLERQAEPLQVRDGGVSIEMTPFQIATVCLIK